ncbi:hypothetical protein C2G38_2145883 [Gigaspora rosea]|uniref:Uncharacterized protein n=1 Tax=Gigaspora rosea TaxID=44941 RepID=A0A397UL01_9GLOM|nr:hypothetical protein C2G38_2145883 [Gigaspora rosea]
MLSTLKTGRILKRKNLSYILENIKKDLEKVANSESEFDEERRNKAQEIIDHWKLWKASSKKRKMNLKRDFSHFKINSLKVKQHMVATGSNAIQISNSRKHLRNNHGEPVKISSEKIVECDLDFNETDVRDQDLTGRAFLRLTEEKLTRKPGFYELKPSPAESIMELVEELNKKLEKHHQSRN